MKRIFLIFFAVITACLLPVSAQELNCTVEINSSKIEGTDKSPFEELQEAITE